MSCSPLGFAARDYKLFHQMLLPIRRPGDPFDIDIGKIAEEVRHSGSLEEEAEPYTCKWALTEACKAIGFNHVTLAN